VSTQRVAGNRNVQIQGVVGSRIQITYGETPRTVPLEPAHVPVARKLRSPARLVRAHAGVIPYVDRGGLIGELESWIDSEGAFSGQLISGRGGAGKTRLAVELCQRLEESGWLCGFLIRIADREMLNALVEVPTPRLVVVDYAETRPEQLELLLPLLSAKASREFPVRVLLLVRGDAEGSGHWEERLANRVDSLDTVLDECEVRRLEDARFQVEEREALFGVAVPALVKRLDPESGPAAPPDLRQEVFASPLMVVIAAYLAALGENAPRTREELLDEVLAHERRYWRESAADLDADNVLLERLVALATLLRADSEEEAERHLSLLPYIRDAPAERRNRLARWVRSQYPGSHWWNPLEPDLVGERLIARSFIDQPEVLRGAMATEDPEQVTRPLEVLARAAASNKALAEALSPILSLELERLCRVAVVQAETVRDADLLYGKAVTVAGTIDALLRVVAVDAAVLPIVGNLMPSRPNLVLNELSVTLAARYAEHLRPLAEEDHSTHAPELGRALNNLSNNLAHTGQDLEALAIAEEATKLRRRLAVEDPSTYRPELARSLNNLANRLAAARRHPEALAAIEESVKLRRSLAEDDPVTYGPELAGSLSNLSSRLQHAERHPEALVAIEESVATFRALAQANLAAHAPELAGTLNNLASCLAEVDRHPESLPAIEESTAIFRRLAEDSPAAYTPELARSLNNLSKHFRIAGRRPEAIAAAEESVRLRRLLADANPAAYGLDLAKSLYTYAEVLAEDEREVAASEARSELAAVLEALGGPEVDSPE
jgi:hypothetical protein